MWAWTPPDHGMPRWRSASAMLAAFAAASAGRPDVYLYFTMSRNSSAAADNPGSAAKGICQEIPSSFVRRATWPVAFTL